MAEEFLEEFFTALPNQEDIIEISGPDGRGSAIFPRVQGFLLHLSHKEVGKGRSHFSTHGYALDLSVALVIEQENIVPNDSEEQVPHHRSEGGSVVVRTRLSARVDPVQDHVNSDFLGDV